MDKKILFLTYRLGYGPLLYWDSILTEIKKNFNNFRIFTANEEQTTENNSVKTEQKIGGLKYYRNGNLDKSLLFIPTPFFIYEILKFKPNIIIINEFNIVSLYVVLFRRLFSKTKILLLVESDPYLGNEVTIKKNLKYFYRKYICKNVDLILTNNSLGENYIRNYLEIKKTDIIGKPYLTSVPNKKEINLEKSNKINFIFVGRFVKLKGLDYLLEALNSLSHDVKEQINFYLIGDGDQRELLEEYKLKHKLNFVTFTGKIPYEELNYYYTLADCFVMPTLQDYRSLVSFEALAYGCAIIESDFNGARFESVVDNKNGFIINPKNINEISEKIEFLVKNKDILENFKKKSSELSKNFSYEKCNENLINILKKL